MKLTATQLRNIIREEVNKTKLHESKKYMDSYGLLMDAIYDEYLAVCPVKPKSRVATPRELASIKQWQRDSSRAWEDLQAKFEELQNEVRSALLNGDYADGSPAAQRLD